MKPMKLDSQRHLFDIPEDITYLNCGYMSPLMHAVRDAGVEGLTRKCQPWKISPRGVIARIWTFCFPFPRMQEGSASLGLWAKDEPADLSPSVFNSAAMNSRLMRRWTLGFESDPALMAWPALQVRPPRFPSIRRKNTGLAGFFLFFLARLEDASNAPGSVECHRMP